MKNVDLRAFETTFLQFESAWRGMEIPAIRDFVPEQLSSADIPMLVELVKIDLEHRLRRGLTRQVDDYTADFPELGEASIRSDLSRYATALQYRVDRGTLKRKELVVSPSNESEPKLSENGVPVQGQVLDTLTNADSPSTHDLDSGTRQEFAPGTSINQYVIEQRAGSGAFATVYAARDKSLGRRVALKMLKCELADGPDASIRIIREAQIVAALSHENIVPVFEIGKFQGRDYIVSQFVEGQSLEDWLQTHPVDIPTAIEIASQVADALAHAHQFGIIHRDVKPANIILENGKPRLLDFGLARLNDASLHLTHVGDIVGTPAYMPPEQADGRAWEADQRSDIYSLGALIFRMTTGVIPFQGTAIDVVNQVIHKSPPSPRRINRDVGKDLEVITLKCLEKDPSDRYQTAEAVAQDLNNYLAGRPIVARPPGLPHRMLKWSKRRPLTAALVLLTSLATAFAIGMSSQLVNVRNQRDQANAATSEAVNAKLKLQALLAAEAADAGRLAMQRGQLDKAVELFERSLAMGYTQASELRLKKVESLMAIRHWDRARSELDELADELGDSKEFAPDAALWGEVLLWRAELTMSGTAKYGDPIELLTAAVDHDISPAAKSYALAMLAENSPEAVRRFRQALAHDPFHHHARRMLISMLIGLARFDEAAAEIKTASELFPEDCDFVLFRALILAAQNSETDDVIATLPLSDSEKEDWRGFCDYLRFVGNKLVIAEGTFGYDADVVRDALSQFTSEYLPLLTERRWYMPPKIAPHFEGFVRKILSVDAAPEMATEELRAQFDLLRRLVAVHPEGSLCSIFGERLTAYHNAVLDEEHGQLAQIDPAILQEAVVAFEQSMEVPRLVRSVRQTSHIGIIGASLGLALIHQVDVEENMARFISAASATKPEQVTDVSHIRAICIGLLNAKQYDLAVPWCERWLQVVGPQDFDAVWHRLMADRWRLRWYNVLKQCNQAIQNFPDVEMLQNLRAVAERELKKELDAGVTD